MLDLPRPGKHVDVRVVFSAAVVRLHVFLLELLLDHLDGLDPGAPRKKNPEF